MRGAFLWLAVGLIGLSGCGAKPAGQAQGRVLCRYETLDRDQPNLFPATVVGSAPITLLGDQNGCPAKGATCPRPASVKPGEEVLVGDGFEDYACVYKTIAPYRSGGWLPVANLQTAAPDETTPSPEWGGAWRTPHSRIDIKTGSGPIWVTGSSGMSGMIGRNTPVSSFQGEGVESGDTLSVLYGQCKVLLRQVGAYLVATDNGRCGPPGAGVADVYSRATP